MEKKTHVGRLEVKIADAGSPRTFSGYGAVFGNTDAYGDVIAHGAFSKSLAEHQAAGTTPAMLWNHNALDLPIGVWLRLVEDAVGLKVNGTFLDTFAGNDAYTAVKAGAVSGLSIGFICTGYTMQGENRLITEVKLMEISVVTFPANDLARVESVKTKEIDVEVKSLLEELMAEIKALHAKIDAKDALRDEKSADDEDCDCEDDEECECDDGEAKYNNAAIAAVETLSLKLSQERHG